MHHKRNQEEDAESFISTERRNKMMKKICPDYGKPTKGRNELGLCRVCALKRFYLSQNPILNSQKAIQ